MKRRSEEYLSDAERFLAASRALLEAGISENSASEAYRAMLLAARAALSEEGREAKTHRGTWSLFDALFVRTERFDRGLRDAARDGQELRLDSDYRLGGATPEEAREMLSAAERFLAAVREMFAGRA